MIHLFSKSLSQIFILFFLMLLASCKDGYSLKESKQERENSESTSRQSSGKKIFSFGKSEPAELNPHQQKVAQYNLYIDCLNKLQSHKELKKIYEDYVREIKKPAGECPAYPSSPLFHMALDPRDIGEKLQTCQNKLDKASKDIYPESHTALNTFVERLGAQKKLLQDAHDYFKLENFKDDACAKGKQLTKQIPAGFESVFAGAGNLSKSLQGAKKEIGEYELVEIEKKFGKKFDWQVRRFLLDLDDFMAQVRNGGKENYLKSYGVFAASAQTFTDYMQAQEAEIKKDQFRPYFQLHTKNIFDDAKVLKRRVEEGSPTFERELANLRRSYSGFISHYNNYIQYAPSHGKE